MCGRFSNRLTWREIHDLYAIHDDFPAPNLEPRSNVSPTQKSLVVRLDPASGRRQALFLRWGLIPFWSKSPKDMKLTTINARSETITSKPAFRDAVKKRRAILPVCAWYEFTGEPGAKQPWRFVRVDGEPISLAAVWDRWLPKGEAEEGEASGPVESFAIATTSASADTAEIHDRMPVVLEKSDIDLWLDPDPNVFERQLKLLKPAAPGTIRHFPVSKKVSSSRNEGAELIEPIELV